MATRSAPSKAAAKRPRAAAAAAAPAPTPTRRTAAATSRIGAGIRVRMYRVGFGDFFLLTVPGSDGQPAHILIDCGVHAANLGTMDACVKDLMEETQRKLALVVLTHYHADHMSGFASNYDDFAQFTVSAVWITNRLDPADPAASAFHAQLQSVAQQLQLKLGARSDAKARQAQDMVSNGIGLAAEGGGGSNAKALKLLREGFANKPKVQYCGAGGKAPRLPAELQGVLEAQILAPAPKDKAGNFTASDNRVEQYLAAAGDNEDSFDQAAVKPFDKAWPARAADYPVRAFADFKTSNGQKPRELALELEGRLQRLQPDTLLAAASSLDGTLNNQSLVILFTCKGKKLLFVGDAQWGNWAYWLYGKSVTGNDPGILAQAKAILGSVDFYKVGHHGSTNANPIPAMAAINARCVCMCSTATGAYGSPDKKTEVPRTALMDGVKARTRYAPVRSDWLTYLNHAADPQATAEMPALPPGFSTTAGKPYIDFHL